MKTIYLRQQLLVNIVLQVNFYKMMYVLGLVLCLEELTLILIVPFVPVKAVVFIA